MVGKSSHSTFDAEADCACEASYRIAFDSGGAEYNHRTPCMQSTITHGDMELS